MVSLICVGGGGFFFFMLPSLKFIVFCSDNLEVVNKEICFTMHRFLVTIRHPLPPLRLASFGASSDE